MRQVKSANIRVGYQGDTHTHTLDSFYLSFFFYHVVRDVDDEIERNRLLLFVFNPPLLVIGMFLSASFKSLVEAICRCISQGHQFTSSNLLSICVKCILTV